MKIIRHILSHLLLIALLAAVSAVYFYRYQVLPERYVQKIDHYAEVIHPKLVNVAYRQDIKQETSWQEVAQAKQEIDVIYVDDIPLVDDSKKQLAGQQPTEETTEGMLTSTMGAQEDRQNNESLKTVEAQQASNDIKVAEEKENQEEEVRPDNLVEEKVVKHEEQIASGDKEAADYMTVLRDARMAFGQGNMEQAIKKYSELIALEDEADFHGELGNVYYAMGKWNKAGEAYYEAAVRLIDDGQLAQVGYLQRVIQGLDAERADKLAAQIAKPGK